MANKTLTDVYYILHIPLSKDILAYLNREYILSSIPIFVRKYRLYHYMCVINCVMIKSSRRFLVMITAFHETINISSVIYQTTWRFYLSDRN